MSRDLAKERQQWAVDLMQVKPDDRVLEIGCGTGLAASLVCEKLKDGKLVAIDRSTGMIGKAKLKNKTYVDLGMAHFLAGVFAALDWTGQSFDKTFSFNVNVFWMKPDDDLPVLRDILSARGQTFFFYTPPDEAQLKKIKARLPALLETHQFTVKETFEAKFGATRAFGLKARARPVPMGTGFQGSHF